MGAKAKNMQNSFDEICTDEMSLPWKPCNRCTGGKTAPFSNEQALFFA
jgi:hypothetical protein